MLYNMLYMTIDNKSLDFIQHLIQQLLYNISYTTLNMKQRLYHDTTAEDFVILQFICYIHNKLVCYIAHPNLPDGGQLVCARPCATECMSLW